MRDTMTLCHVDGTYGSRAWGADHVVHLHRFNHKKFVANLNQMAGTNGNRLDLTRQRCFKGASGYILGPGGSGRGGGIARDSGFVVLERQSPGVHCHGSAVDFHLDQLLPRIAQDADVKSVAIYSDLIALHGTLREPGFCVTWRW